MRSTSQSSRLAGVLIAIALLVCPGSLLYAEHTGLVHESDIFGEIATIGSSTSMSLAPILAYEPTFGTIFGAAVFLEKPFATRFSFKGRLAFSTEGEYSALVALKRYDGPDKFYQLEVEVDDFARPYYGEGMDTNPDESILIEGTTSRLLYFLQLREGGKVSFGPFLDYRGANEEGVDGSSVAAPEYDEATLGLGWQFFYDNRDSQLNPESGVFDTLILRLVPDALSTGKGSNSFLQAELDHRIFYSPAPGMVLAGRLLLAGSLGDPTYQYRFSLGGPDELRGFYTNRFRGKNLYIVQGEVRQDLFWIFSGAAFAEVGEVTDDRFGSPETSYGAGLRMTLPPNHIAKARLDFAWAKDQHSIYLTFVEAF